VSALADAVEREMDAAGFRTAHLTGNSMGGWISLELARRGRARTVVAISPAGGGNRRERAYARNLMKSIWLAARAVSPAAKAVAVPGPTRLLLFGTFYAQPNNLAWDDAAYMVRAYAGGPHFAEACDSLFSGRAGGLEDVRCPVTVAWGTRDLLLFPRQAHYFLARIAQARHVPLERLGHTPMSDDPARVAAAILETTAPAH
jgi:pimeloyl-ACP methyl ester carboxylesterase